MNIGLFDSGVGGLSCLRTLVKRYPGHKFVYLGDTARLPYGTKSQETIKKYTQQNIATLMGLGVDLIISACHSASSAILLQKITAEVPLFEVVTPTCELVARAHGPVGILATASTVSSEIYPRSIAQLNSQLVTIQQAAPLLVSLVEAGWCDDPVTNLVIQRYVRPLLAAKVSSIILGCTHFPILARAIQNVVGPEITLIDPAAPLADRLLPFVVGEPGPTTEIAAYLTDLSPHFVQLAQEIGPEVDGFSVQQI